MLMYELFEVEHFVTLKRGGSIIRGGAIFGGNTVSVDNKLKA